MAPTTRASGPVMALWAKLRKEEGTEGAYHPLIYHLLDVAASAEALWEGVMTPPAREEVAGSLGLPVEEAGRWIAFLAGLHDLGKASPAFFQQDGDGAARLRFAGCEPGPPVDNAPHGTISARELRHIVTQFGVGKRLARRLAAAVGGHHGQIPSADRIRMIPVQSVGDDFGSWPGLRESLVEMLAEALAIPDDPVPERLENPAAFWLAGMVSVADWIGSNQAHFGFEAPDALRPPPYDPQYLAHARRSAHEALTDLGWLAQPAAPGTQTFEGMFGFQPNAMQQAVIDLGDRLNLQGLVIVEAPMGQGKTEAALWLADQWRMRLGQRGFYVALPTQATSNQMFGRVADFLLKRYPAETVNLQLLHGHASLSAQFGEMRREGHRLFRPGDIGEHIGTQNIEGAVAAAEWFTYRKRGLLAPFGVGTVDQALLAALQTKHVFVRLFGLAHKTVIVDEVHAYDLYMSSLLDRLLEWLAALGSTVVLLSATLPDARRKELALAYGQGLGTAPTIGEAPYPRITWLAQRGAETWPIAPGHSKTIGLSWVGGTLSDGEQETFVLGERLQEALANGGTAAVICNTVGRAQDVYRALKPYFPEIAADGKPELDLLHARFPFDIREEREQRTLLRFGKPGAEVDVQGRKEKVQRPHRAVLVSTQIVEQSLDLDFDLMVTDLAPADLVLQRAGRLWRHERDERPVSGPSLWIMQPPEDDEGLPQFDRGSQYVYFPHVLLRSWLALRDRSRLTLPDDMELLVEAVYGGAAREDLSPAMQALWVHTWGEQEKQLRLEQQEAAYRTIASIGDDAELSEIQGGARDEDRPDLHPAHQAMTRLADPSLPIVLLEDRDGRLTLPSGRVVDPSKEPDARATRHLLRRSLTLANPRILRELKDVPPPAGWQRSPLLRNHRLVALLPDGRNSIGGCELTLDPELGLLISQKGGD